MEGLGTCEDNTSHLDEGIATEILTALIHVITGSFSHSHL